METHLFILQWDLPITQPVRASADRMCRDMDDSLPAAFSLVHAVLVVVAEMQEVETPRSRKARGWNGPVVTASHLLSAKASHVAKPRVKERGEGSVSRIPTKGLDTKTGEESGPIISPTTNPLGVG